MTAYEFKNVAVEKLAFRIGELKTKLEFEKPETVAAYRLQGNIGALEWALREVTAIPTPPEVSRG